MTDPRFDAGWAMMEKGDWACACCGAKGDVRAYQDTWKASGARSGMRAAECRPCFEDPSNCWAECKHGGAPRMTAQPTPGPWRVQYAVDLIIYGDKDTVAKVPLFGMPRRLRFTDAQREVWERQHANARLIAAAPALRDALIRLLRQAREDAEAEWAGQEDDAMRQAEAALKAAGEGA